MKVKSNIQEFVRFKKDTDENVKLIPSKLEKVFRTGLEYVVTTIQTKYLTGPRPEKLGVVTGRLRSSIGYLLRPGAKKMTAEVGTKVEYAAIHEYGGVTRAHTILPKNKKALFWPGARHPVKLVQHPGSKMPARPFVEPGVKESIPKIERLLESVGYILQK